MLRSVWRLFERNLFTSSFSSVLLLWLGDIISSSLSHVLLQYTELRVYVCYCCWASISLPYTLVTTFLTSVSSDFFYFTHPSSRCVCTMFTGNCVPLCAYTPIYRTLVVQLNYACVQSTIVPLTISGKHTLCERIHRRCRLLQKCIHINKNGDHENVKMKSLLMMAHKMIR